MFGPKKDKAEKAPENGGWLQRLRRGLSKTRRGLGTGLGGIFGGQRAIDDELLEELKKIYGEGV